MNPVMAAATLHHLAVSLVIFVALITENTEVSWKKKQNESTTLEQLHNTKATRLLVTYV